MLILLLALIPSAYAQITDASFFPSMRSINPGVVHMRKGGFISGDYGKKKNEKVHDITAGGIVGGVKTDVDLTKKTFFGAAATRFISTEILFDQEEGEKTEFINSTTRGKRTITDEADSTYYGGMFDFRFFGVSYAGANYNYTNNFRVGTPPDLTARDEAKELNYTNLKIGSAIKIGNFRVGAFFMNQKADGDYSYTFYDPATGNKGSTEKTDVKLDSKGFGFGVGYSVPSFRTEASLEKITSTNLDIDENYPGTSNKPDPASRISFVAEARFKWFSLGARVRSIKGNYVDLEDIISNNLLYDSFGPDDTRTETSFNFSLGDSKGFSPSAFYTQSDVTTNEEDTVFNTGNKYKARTKARAYGVNLSYRF